MNVCCVADSSELLLPPSLGLTLKMEVMWVLFSYKEIGAVLVHESEVG